MPQSDAYCSKLHGCGKVIIAFIVSGCDAAEMFIRAEKLDKVTVLFGKGLKAGARFRYS